MGFKTLIDKIFYPKGDHGKHRAGFNPDEENKTANTDATRLDQAFNEGIKARRDAN